MKALLIIAHGSRRTASNIEVERLAQQLKHRHDCSFDIVEAAFLELAETLIPDGIERCVQAGASEIIVTPYFLNSGKHVTEDIPAVINTISPHYPDISFYLTPHVGASLVMPELILETAQNH